MVAGELPVSEHAEPVELPLPIPVNALIPTIDEDAAFAIAPDATARVAQITDNNKTFTGFIRINAPSKVSFPCTQCEDWDSL